MRVVPSPGGTPPAAVDHRMWFWGRGIRGRGSVPRDGQVSIRIDGSRRTAGACALCRPDNGDRRLATWPRHIEDGEGSTWPLEVVLEPDQARVKSFKPGDPLGDIRAAFADEAGQLGGRV